jgi:DNA repair exonuclease SbcCD ATPase subunit
MANINMEELEKNAQGLNEVLNETNELLGSINDQKQDILATDTQIHHSEIDIRNTLRGQNKELDTQDTSLGVILNSLKEEIAKLERIYSLYEQIGTQIGRVNRGTKKAEEFEELRFTKLNEIKEVYRLIREEVAKNNTNVSEDLTNIQEELDDLDDTLQDVQDKGPLYKHYKVDQHALREINEEIEKVEEKLEKQKERYETTTQVVQKIWGAVKGVSTDAYNKWSEINQKVFEFGRNAGLAVDQMRAVQKNVLESYGQMAARLGMTYEEIFKFQEQYVQ